MAGVIRADLGLPLPERPVWQGEPVARLTGRIELLDASTTSALFDEGAWQDPQVLDREALKLLDAGADVVWTPSGTATLSGSPTYGQASPTTVTTGLTLWLREPLPAKDFRGHLLDSWLTQTPAPEGHLPSRTRIQITAPAPGQQPPPLLVEAGYRAGWETVTIDPAPAFGLSSPASRITANLLQRRRLHLAEVQEHYYADPPQIERGWREHLIDTDGQVYLDMVNNVASVGHAHPRLAEVAARQFRLLNTNSRFNYAAITEFAERLTATLPDELDTVFFVNSGSEAADLAIRLAMAATGRPGIVAMREAYHAGRSPATPSPPRSPTTPMPSAPGRPGCTPSMRPTPSAAGIGAPNRGATPPRQ